MCLKTKCPSLSIRWLRVRVPSSSLENKGLRTAPNVSDIVCPRILSEKLVSVAAVTPSTGTIEPSGPTTGGSSVAHFPKPYFRKNRGRWYVQIDDHQHNLGADEKAAFDRYHELMRQRP